MTVLASHSGSRLAASFDEVETGQARDREGASDAIPTGWQMRPLLSLVSLPTGQVDPRHEPYRSMILIAPDHVESGTGRLLARVTAAQQAAISGKFLFAPGDIVYSKIRPYLRKLILTDFQGLCSADMYPLTPVPGVLPAFIFAVLLGDRFSSFAESVSVRSGIPKINREELAQYSLPLPSFVEQRAIAESLRDTDQLSEALRELIAKKRAIMRAAMQGLLSGSTRLPGFQQRSGYRRTETGLIPNDWEVVQLSRLFRFRNGVNAAKAAYGKGIPFINVLEIINKSHLRIADIPGRISLPREIADAYAVRRGDLVFNRTSETQEELGLASVYLTDAPVVFGGFVIRGRPLRDTLDTIYAGYALRARGIRSQIIAKGQGAIRANIGQSDLRQVLAPLPSLPEQRAIAAVLSDLDADIAALERRRDKTRAIKQGMMQALLTGRVRLLPAVPAAAAPGAGP